MKPIKLLIFSILVISWGSSCYGFLDIFAAIGAYFYEKLTFGCTESELPSNFEELRKTLSRKLYGQPLVESILTNSLKSHWDKSSEPDKALTISFHGGPGVGKNYVSQFIANALYKDGMKSPYVHYFNARLNFPEVDKVAQYKNDLSQWIIGNVSKCPKQLFIFDEVHQYPPGVLDALKPFIDYMDFVNGKNFRLSIYIFLSNTGSTVINENAYDLWNKGISREEIRHDTFEKIIATGAFNEKGGFHHSETIKSNLIDHYVPFLPLMKSHVILCIKESFRKLNNIDPTEKQIQAVLDFIDWGPNSNNGVFAKTGCKRISQKVRLLSY